MEAQNEDEVVSNLISISRAAYADEFKKLYEKTQAELKNALAFIELQKNSMVSARINAIYDCLLEVRAIRGFATRESQVYLDSLIDVLNGKIKDANIS